MNTRRSHFEFFSTLRPIIAAGWLLRIQFLAVWAIVIGCTTSHAVADPNYIADLTFFDRSPGSPRAKPYQPVLRQDANDASFAGAAGWGDGIDTWQKQFDHTKSLAVSHPNSGLVFIGDSVTQNWGNVNGREVNGSGAGVWNSATYNYSRFDALNFGIAGDQTQNVIYRVANGQFNGLNPGLVVLMIGTNNRFAPTSDPGFPILDYPAPAHTAEEIADGVLATVQAIHQKLPTSHILTLSTIRGLNNSDPDRIAVNQANSLVSQAFTTDTNPLLDYLDVSALYRNPDGTINGNINGDGVHFNSAGYAALANAIAPYVNQYATLNPATAVTNVALHGSAFWTNSVDGSFGHFAKDVIDDNQDTFAHSDNDGSFGGNPAKPDSLTVQLEKTYDLKNIQIVNRGASDGGSAVSDARLNGVLLQVLDGNSNVLYSTTLADDPTLFGETLTLDNSGQGFAGAKFVRLTSNDFINISEIRANISAVPEPAALSMLAAGGLLGCLILWQRNPWNLTRIAQGRICHERQAAN